MAKSLILYPFADGTIGHSKSNTSVAAYSLINEYTNNTEGYLGQTFSFDGVNTLTSSFSSLTPNSSVTTLNKFRLNSISSVNLYFAKYKNAYTSSNVSITNLNIFGQVTLDGANYTSASYTDGSATNSRTPVSQSLAIPSNTINKTYQSIRDLNLTFLLSTAGRGSDTDSSGTKNRAADLRIYNANITISYDDVFDCGVQVVTGYGITNATASESEVVEGEPCTFSATIENGYIFDGWYDNENFDGDSYSTDATFTMRIIEDITLYPKAVKEGVVPPEEDPTKIFFPIIISAINARTSPSKGTTKIESGTSRTVKITPKDPLLTVALDNGNDITSQLVQHGDAIQYPTVETVTGARYGFTLNSSTGYYTSTNNGITNSASLCRLSFNLPVRCLVTIQYINYAEETFDYGIFGNIDEALSTGNTSDSNAYRVLSSEGDNSSTPQTLTYEIESGTHFIDVKYRKDAETDKYNDSLQFKVLGIEALEVYDFYYTYNIENIDKEHSLNFVFGNVEYYFVTSQTESKAQLYPYGQAVVLPDDEYKLTIVPENQNEIVTLFDNGVDVSSQMEVVNVETIKDGQKITIINYIYRISNVQETHSLNVQTTKPIIPQSIKISDKWKDSDLFRKIEGEWVRISLMDIYLHNNVKWIKDASGQIKTNNIVFKP